MNIEELLDKILKNSLSALAHIRGEMIAHKFD